MDGLMEGSCPRMGPSFPPALCQWELVEDILPGCLQEGHPCAASRAGLSSSAGLQPAGCKLEGVGIPALSRAPGDGCSPRTRF